MKRNLFNFIVVVALLVVTAVACNRDKPVTGVTLDYNTLELFVDDPAILNATINPVDAANKLVTWTSSHPDIVEVIAPSRGSIIARAIGTATITVTTTDGGYTAKCVVTVSPLPNPIIPEMILVEGGTFIMGCSDGDGKCVSNEKPNFEVRLDSYYIAKYPVTQREWRTIMRSNPSIFQGDDRPVENISWEEVNEFIEKLNAATGNKYEYRLATEAEWEYAARGGKNNGPLFSGSSNIDEVAWYKGNSVSTERPNGETHPVGRKKANELGIHDMSGNVWEWCSDLFGSYSDTTRTGLDTVSGIWVNPQGPTVGIQRVARGGSCLDPSDHCRISARYAPTPPIMTCHLGIRLVMPVK